MKSGFHSYDFTHLSMSFARASSFWRAVANFSGSWSG